MSVLALPDEDVTRFFRLSGNCLAPALDAPKLLGTVMATAARSPWCREWRWTTPAIPSSGLPEGTCNTDDETRDDTDYWFFLLRNGLLVEDFSLPLSWNYEGVYEEEYDFGRDALLYFDAQDIAANDGEVLTDLVDRVGNQITLTGSLDVWFVDAEAEYETYEPYIQDGETWIWEAFSDEMLTWDGVLPDTAVKKYACKSLFDATTHALPCVRLETSCTKVHRWGLSWTGWSPALVCYAAYSNARKKTLFVVASTQEVFALGPDMDTGYVPAGYGPREIVNFELCGDTSNKQNDGTNIGAYWGDTTQVALDLAHGGGFYTWSDGSQYTSLLRWYHGADSNYHLAAQHYPAATPTLITVEMDAETETFSVFVNGVLQEILRKGGDAPNFENFPISVLRFESFVTFFNDLFDSRGVSYSARQDIFTAILFEGHFEESERQQHEAYLMQRWGIA